MESLKLRNKVNPETLIDCELFSKEPRHANQDRFSNVTDVSTALFVSCERINCVYLKKKKKKAGTFIHWTNDTKIGSGNLC